MESASEDFGNERSRPVVQISDRFMRDISAEVWAVIESANKPPGLFQRGHLLVDIILDDHGQPAIRTLEKPVFLGILDRWADFMSENRDGPNSVVAGRILLGAQLNNVGKYRVANIDDAANIKGDDSRESLRRYLVFEFRRGCETEKRISKN